MCRTAEGGELLDDLGTDPAEKDAARKVVKKLADARLVTTSYDQQTKFETAEIIHDSLIREWGRLRDWLREDRSFLAWDREIEKKDSLGRKESEMKADCLARPGSGRSPEMARRTIQ